MKTWLEREGDLTRCSATNQCQDLGELGVIMMTQSKRAGFRIGPAFIYPWLEKA